MNKNYQKKRKKKRRVWQLPVNQMPRPVAAAKVAQRKERKIKIIDYRVFETISAVSNTTF